MSSYMATKNQTATADAVGNPEWLRVREACQFSRLSKPKLYDLLGRGLIKSCSLRERGMVRGTRLISFDSLRAFLESRSSGGIDVEEARQTTPEPDQKRKSRGAAKP